MSRLDPEKLSVEYRDGVSKTEPIKMRRYTLTHSDITAELFLTIGLTYAYDKTNAMRDEVIGEWMKSRGKYYFNVYLYVDGQFGPTVAAIRNYIFRRELPLALEAMRYGDQAFFRAHPELDNAPIIVYFMSSDLQYQSVENWGTFANYDISSEKGRSRSNRLSIYLLDMKMGDVNGDEVIDKVYLYGNKPDGPTGIFADNITVVIEDGRTNQSQTIIPDFNAGYNPTIFLGDFTKDHVQDIKLSIESGGSGGYGYFYIYSYRNNDLQEIFNFEMFNDFYKFKVDYADLYKVNVGNVALDKLFVIDISTKGFEYLSQYYDENGKLKQPVQGEVLAINSLFPIVKNEKENTYDILAFQRIIGTFNADTLGFIQNLLTWDGQKFVSSQMFAATLGTNLIALY